MKRRASTPRRAWTDADEARLRRLAAHHTAPEIARLLKRTHWAIKEKSRRLGVRLQKYGDLHPKTRHSDATVREILRRYFDERQPVRDISAALGVPLGSVTRFTSGWSRPALRREVLER